MPNSGAERNDLYQDVTATYGRAMERLARAYEADPDRRQDLLQEIHLEVWKSLGLYESRCALRTWVYRVAHNTAAKHVIRRCRTWQITAALLIIAWLTPGALRRNSADPLAIVLPAVLFAAAGLIVLMAVRKFQARRIQADLQALTSFENENRPGGGDDIPFNKSKG